MLQALEVPLTTRIEEVRRQVSINFDVLQLVDRAVEVQLEREWEHSGVFARMYGALGADDVAWSIGTASGYTAVSTAGFGREAVVRRCRRVRRTAR